MHEALGTLDEGLVRVSFSHFNTKNEVDILLNALKMIDTN
jgi:selenocysteine lyase/cysteine desulfurase